MGQMLEFLKELLDDATAGLSGVTTRRAFGSWGYYVDRRIFALAYAREDRLGVKLPDDAAYASARSLAGASEWAPHGSPMSDWVLLPEELHDDREAVEAWVARAFQLVRATPASAPRKAAPSKERAPAKATTKQARATPKAEKTKAEKTKAEKTKAEKNRRG
jgi:TfoX/Sxy family transcriptional regulator of competence genes